VDILANKANIDKNETQLGVNTGLLMENTDSILLLRSISSAVVVSFALFSAIAAVFLSDVVFAELMPFTLLLRHL
jgi:hypothetical protein